MERNETSQRETLQAEFKENARRAKWLLWCQRGALWSLLLMTPVMLFTPFGQFTDMRVVWVSFVIELLIAHFAHRVFNQRARLIAFHMDCLDRPSYISPHEHTSIPRIR